MKWLPRILATSLLSMSIAFVLSFLSDMQFSLPHLTADMKAFNPFKPKRLNDQNLVDIMVELPLQLHLRKVDLSRTILYVDLQDAGSAIDERSVYDDLFQISQLGFDQTVNVDQVLVRVIDSQSGNLLLAMDARRQNWVEGEAEKAVKNDELDRKTFLRHHYRFTITQKWKDSFEK